MPVTFQDIERVSKMLEDYRALHRLICRYLPQFNFTWGMLQEAMPDAADPLTDPYMIVGQGALLLTNKYLPIRLVVTSPDGENFNIEDLCRRFFRLRQLKKKIQQKIAQTLTDV